MGTNVTLGVAADGTVAPEAEVATGLEMGWAVAGSALAEGVALDGAPVADDVLVLQADSEPHAEAEYRDAGNSGRAHEMSQTSH
jgi:hypothetical protein